MKLLSLGLAGLLLLSMQVLSTRSLAQNVGPVTQSTSSTTATLNLSLLTTSIDCTFIEIESLDPDVPAQNLMDVLFLDPAFASRSVSQEMPRLKNTVRVQLYRDLDNEGADYLTANQGTNFYSSRDLRSKDPVLLAAKVVHAVINVCRPEIKLDEPRHWPHIPEVQLNVPWESFSYCVVVSTSWSDESTVARGIRANGWIQAHSIAIHEKCEPGDKVIEVRHVLTTIDWPFKIRDANLPDEMYSSHVSAYEKRRAAQRLADALVFLFAGADAVPFELEAFPTDTWKAKRLATRLGQDTGNEFKMRFEKGQLIGSDDTGRRIVIPLEELLDARVESRGYHSPFDSLLLTPEQFEDSVNGCGQAWAYCAGLYLAVVIPTQFIRWPDKPILDITYEDALGQQEISLQITAGDAGKLERVIDEISRTRKYRVEHPAALRTSR